MLSPVIELFGFLCTILAYVIGIINLPVTLAIFGIYAAFGALLTVITFTTRNFLSEYKVRMWDIVKAYSACCFQLLLQMVQRFFCRCFLLSLQWLLAV